MAGEIVRWLLIIEGGQLLAYPLTAQLFRYLPSKGVAFSRIIGLLLTGYCYWILNELGVIRNNPGGLLLALLPMVLLSAYFYKKNFYELVKWTRENDRFLFISELVFLAGFTLIVVFRIADPSIAGTEKPMEMMFINSILSSETFPPQDGWLAGYGISYYYYGYLLSAVLIMLSNVPSAVGFNLMLATVFGMAAAGAFTIVNDLVQKDPKINRVKIHLSALLAPLVMLVMGNLEGFLEVLHARGFFWNAEGSYSFWKWLGIKELDIAPTIAAAWNPTGRAGIWWWRASRVLSDTGLDGSSKEIIDEFPFFSFFLGDLHPHVIGIPFVLTALAAALNLYFQKQHWGTGSLNARPDEFWLSRMTRFLKSQDFWFAAFAIGGLLFMNTWDFPIYFGILILAAALARSEQENGIRKLAERVLIYGVPLGVACLGLYGLFMSALSSQAGGIVPSGVFATRPIHFLIMFGCFLLPVVVWGFLSGKNNNAMTVKKSFFAALKIFSAMFIASAGLYLILMLVARAPLDPANGGTFSGIQSLLKTGGDAYAGVQGAAESANPAAGFLLRRLNNLPLMALLFGLLALAFSILSKINQSRSILTDFEGETRESPVNNNDRFVGILLLVAVSLAVFPEFFYLRDFFGTRMNTIFKFYYQVWILFAIIAAYSLHRANDQLRSWARGLVLGISAALIVLGMIYPAFGIAEKANTAFFKLSAEPSTATLDGSTFLQQSKADDWAGIEWLRQADYGVIAEKVGASYTTDNAASTFSGLPAILGPINHESQWRGGYAEIGSREMDVRQIYEAQEWSTIKPILEKYHVRYIFVGSTERSAYTVQERKLQMNTKLVFESGNTRIYQLY